MMNYFRETSKLYHGIPDCKKRGSGADLREEYDEDCHFSDFLALLCQINWRYRPEKGH